MHAFLLDLSPAALLGAGVERDDDDNDDNGEGWENPASHLIKNEKSRLSDVVYGIVV